LSRAWDINDSKLSNFFASSSMEVDIWASNLVGFRGAISLSPSIKGPSRVRACVPC
jgi:hypothetical protein